MAPRVNSRDKRSKMANWHPCPKSLVKNWVSRKIRRKFREQTDGKLLPRSVSLRAIFPRSVTVVFLIDNVSIFHQLHRVIIRPLLASPLLFPSCFKANVLSCNPLVYLAQVFGVLDFPCARFFSTPFRPRRAVDEKSSVYYCLQQRMKDVYV